MRSKLVWIGVVGLIACAAWWWSARAPSERESPAKPTTIDEPSTPRLEQTLAESETATGRAAVGEPTSTTAAVVEAAAPAQTADATLRVHVVAKETGAPLASVHVSVTPRELPAEGWSASWEDRASGTEHEVLTTGEDGRVEFSLRHDVAITVSADGSRFDSGAPTSGLASSNQPPLARGEVREIELAVPTTFDLFFCGRVVAAEDGSPLAGARIRLRETLPGEPPVRVSDADGRFELRSATWLTSRDFTVKLAGRAERTACVAEGHATPEKAFTIRLGRNASVLVRARDSSGASVDGLRVTATTKPWALREQQDLGLEWNFGSFDDPDPSWSVLLDSDGTGVLEELPPNASLAFEVERDERVVLRLSEPLRLEPGETRRLDLVAGSGATLSGTVRDQDGKPVVAARLWLAPAEHELQNYFRTYEQPQHETSTDAGGHYEFSGIAAGKWWLGPAPTRDEGQPIDASALAPLAQNVEIAADATSVELDLTVYRGLYISGTVVDEQGQPAPRANVEVSSEWTTFFEQCDELGHFVAGPLADREFVLVAGGFSDDVHASGETVRARAGATDVLVRVRAGATIVGRVVDDATDQLCAAQLSYGLRTSDGGFQGAVQTSTKGEFELTGLDPGHYVVTAQSGDRLAVAELDALGGRTTEPVILRLMPAGTLVVEWKGDADLADVTVRLGERQVAYAYLGRGAPETLKVLPGDLTIEYVPATFSTEDNEPPIRSAPRVKSVRVAAGESTTLELTDAP